MALSSYFYDSPHQNFLLVNIGDYEQASVFIKNRTKSMSFSTCIFRAHILGPALNIDLASAIVSIPALVPAVTSIEADLFNKFVKIHMDAQIQPPPLAPALALNPIKVEPQKRPFNARFPKLYFGNSCKEYYHFCQPYEN